MRPADAMGAVRGEYSLYTNDPRRPVVNLTVSANIKALPESVLRIQNVLGARGDQVGKFHVWPSAAPVVTAQRGERFSFSVRIRPSELDSGGLELMSKPSDKVDYKLRRETEGTGYWLDIEVKPVSHSGLWTEAITLKTTSATSNDVTINAGINAPANNLLLSDRAIDAGEVALSSLKAGAPKVSRVGVRKLVGGFKITRLSSTLAFLDLQMQPIIEGRNYVIKVSINPGKLPQAGSYSGIIRIETDDAEKPQLEIPYKVTLIDR